MDSLQTTLFYIGFRHYLGKEMNKHWREFKLGWRKRNNWPKRCSMCNRKTHVRNFNKVGYSDDTLTLDHIIPRKLLMELEFIDLLFDDDNYQLYCAKCNSDKSDTKLHPSQLPPRLLEKFHIALEKRNRFANN